MGHGVRLRAGDKFMGEFTRRRAGRQRQLRAIPEGAAHPALARCGAEHRYPKEQGRKLCLAKGVRRGTPLLHGSTPKHPLL